jgi:hypothetical protein
MIALSTKPQIFWTWNGGPGAVLMRLNAVVTSHHGDTNVTSFLLPNEADQV